MRQVLFFCFLTVFNQFSYAQDIPGKYPFTSEREISASDIEGMDRPELRIMRNEIFARYGHIFKSEDLKAYFGKQEWYQCNSMDATALLSDLEKKNIEFIREREILVQRTSHFEVFYTLFEEAVRTGDIQLLTEMTSVDLYSGEDWESSFNNILNEVQDAIESNSPQGDENTMNLSFGEFYQGVQYHWIEFAKKGCCWYIYAIRAAG